MPSRLRQIAVAKTEPGDENNQDISSLVGKVDIRKLETARAERSRRLQLFRRPQPRQPGPARVRRDVQGADQDAAPAADRDAGGQLHRHREYRRHPVPGHHPGPLQRGGVAELQEQQATTKPSSTASTSSRCRTACGSPRSRRSTRSWSRSSELAASPCAPATLEMLARFSRAVAAEASTRTPPLFAKMRVYDGESLKETDPRARSRAGIQGRRRRRRRHGRRLHPLRLQGAGGDLQPRHHRGRRPIRCT